MAARGLTFGGFALRWFAALLLVMGTYNPTDVNYIKWLSANDGLASIKLIVGLIILIGFVIYLRATFVSITRWGVLFGIALFGAILWLISDYIADVLVSGDFLGWFVIIAISTIMAVGMSWSYIRRILSGQITGADGGE